MGSTIREKVWMTRYSKSPDPVLAPVSSGYPDASLRGQNFLVLWSTNKVCAGVALAKTMNPCSPRDSISPSPLMTKPTAPKSKVSITYEPPSNTGTAGDMEPMMPDSSEPEISVVAVDGSNEDVATTLEYAEDS